MFTRPVRFSALVVVSALAIGLVLRTSDVVDRAPIGHPNTEYVAPTDSLVGTVRHIHHVAAPEYLALDTVFPDRPVRLLWFQGLSSSPVPDHGGAVALDGAGGAVRFDERLSPHRVRLRLEGREPISIAARDGGYWATDTDGYVHGLDASGKIVTSTQTGFDFAVSVADPTGGTWLSRSSRMFSFRIATRQDPLLVRVNAEGSASEPVGSIVLPGHVLLAEIANAGHVAIDEDVVFFAPFIRDEVVALSRSGDTLWVAHRGLPQTTRDPRIEIGADGPVIDYAPVNLGIGLGPDGRLYVLSVPGFTTSESRVDVFDPHTGDLIRSAELDDPLPTLAVGEDGRVYELDPFKLLTGVAPTERDPAAEFDLERLDGGRLSLSDLSGKVVLMNFWASWCEPCRTEMPALDSLRQSIEDAEFAFVTMNEDVDVANAQEFIDEYGFDFPVLIGKGKLEQTFHYYGLPYTLAIDRQGRVLQRWIGYTGPEQIAGIRAVIQAELARGAATPPPISDNQSRMPHAGHH